MQHGPAMHTGLSSKKLVSYEVALKGKKQIAQDTYAFTFEKPDEFSFKAGQHIRMTLLNPAETDAEGDKRFFTLASTPKKSDLVFAMRMRDTAFKRVLGNMQIGGKVCIEKLLGEIPPGSFVLHEDASRPAVFIVGGIGIVPACSIIKDAIERKLSHKLFLFYCNRRPEDAPYLNELQKLASSNPSFKLIATMTESGKSENTWRGETGYINSFMLKKYVGHLKSPVYYVSGLPEMVSSMKKLLNDSNVSEDNIRAEEFTGFNLNNITDDKRSSRKSHIALITLVLLIVGVLLVHITGAKSIFHGGLDSLSFKNPLSYLLISSFIIIVVFKLKLLWALRHSTRKDFIRDFANQHTLSKKK